MSFLCHRPGSTLTAPPGMGGHALSLPSQGDELRLGKRRRVARVRDVARVRAWRAFLCSAWRCCLEGRPEPL